MIGDVICLSDCEVVLYYSSLSAEQVLSRNFAGAFEKLPEM